MWQDLVVVDKLKMIQVNLHIFDLIHQIFLGIEMLNCNEMALAVKRFQLAGGAVANKPAVYHNSDVITKRFCLIHSVSSKDNWRIVQAFEHLKQASSRNWVNPCRWLIQEFYVWAADKRHGANEFPLVAAAQILSFNVRVLLKVKGLFNELSLMLNILFREAFYFPNIVQTLVNT